MAKKKESEITLTLSAQVIQSMVDEIVSESVKFDNKERGWKPAGARIRKHLKDIADQCKLLRKHISEVKRSDLS